MEVNFNRTALAEAMGLLTSVVPARTPKPVLLCVQIAAEQGQVRICATDLEVGINHTIPAAEVVEDGEVVVPADKLAAIVRESSDETLVLKSAESGCEIIGADSHFTVYGQQPGQFPPVPGFDKQTDMELSLNSLQAGIEQCLFAAAKESTRYAISGVLWEVKGKKLSLVATDGRRLALSKVALASAPSERFAKAKVIVPAKAMSLLARISRSEKENVAIRLVDSQILFACENTVISSVLVEGNFPKYEDIIPTDYTKKLTLPTQATLSAVRRAALLTSEESRGIKLSLGKDNIVFSARRLRRAMPR